MNILLYDSLMDSSDSDDDITDILLTEVLENVEVSKRIIDKLPKDKYILDLIERK